MGRELHAIVVPQHYQPVFRKGFEIFKKSGQGPAIGNVLERVALRKDGTG